VSVVRYEGFPYRTLVGGRRGQAEGAHYPLRVHHQRRLEPVDPLGLRGASPEGGLPGEQPFTARPHPHHRRDEGRIQDAIDRRGLGELPGEGPLCKARISGSKARTLRLNWPWLHRFGKCPRRCEEAKRQKSRSLRKRGHYWARTARVRTSESARRAGRSGRRGAEEWLACHQSSTSTYNETRKESRSTVGHHLWVKVRYQHKVSAPSSSSAITHQTS
jgi:hypothetical protein